MNKFDEEIAQLEAEIWGICGGENGSATAMLALINVTARMAKAQDFPMSFMYKLMDEYRPDHWPHPAHSFR